MTIFIDDMRRPARVNSIRANWSHMLTDSTDQTALHEFAQAIGMKRRWFQESPRAPWRNHYDLTDAMRRKAIEAGATETTYPGGIAEILRRARAAHQAVAP
jgi:hypothetical protein